MGMVLDTRENEQLKNAISNMFFGSVPERKDEITALIKQLDIVFGMLSDSHNGGSTIMQAGLYRFVQFNHRFVRSFWIGAFAAWEGYRAIAESSDIGEVDINKFKVFVYTFEETINGQQADDYHLPNGIPEPGNFPDKASDPQGRAAAELAIIALGWAFLHEIHHIKHQREGTGAGIDGTPECNQNEEFSCDEFATKFILEEVKKYSDGSGEAFCLVRRKRELAIYIALFSLVLLSKDNWQESDSHPAVQERISAVCRIMGPDRDETAKVIAHAAFTTLRTIWPSAPIVPADGTVNLLAAAVDR